MEILYIVMLVMPIVLLGLFAVVKVAEKRNFFDNKDDNEDNKK
ncbi:unknown [Clostridium sp. CAG:1219]|nr:unknown [Clostridium sp. CAG:1219]